MSVRNTQARIPFPTKIRHFEGFERELTAQSPGDTARVLCSAPPSPHIVLVCCGVKPFSGSTTCVEVQVDFHSQGSKWDNTIGCLIRHRVSSTEVALT